MASSPNLDDLSFLKEIPDLPGSTADSEWVGAVAEGAPKLAAQSQGFSKGAAPSVASLGALPVSPNRAQVQRRRMHAMLLGLAWMGAHLAVYGVRENLGQLPLSYVLVQVAAPFVIGLLSLFLALSPGRLGLGAAVGVTAALALSGPLFFACAALGVPAPLPERVGDWVSHLVCLDLTLVWMSVPLLLFAVHLRGGFASAAGFRSALVGGGCGLFAGGMMNLHCSSVEQIHMVLGHAIPVGIGCLVGGLVASRWLKTS